MLLFTPDLDEAYAWFYATHELTTAPSGQKHWIRLALPAAGGIADQDGKLIETLDYLRTVTNQTLIVKKKTRHHAPPTDQGVTTEPEHG